MSGSGRSRRRTFASTGSRESPLGGGTWRRGKRQNRVRSSDCQAPVLVTTKCRSAQQCNHCAGGGDSAHPSRELDLRSPVPGQVDTSGRENWAVTRDSERGLRRGGQTRRRAGPPSLVMHVAMIKCPGTACTSPPSRWEVSGRANTASGRRVGSWSAQREAVADRS